MSIPEAFEQYRQDHIVFTDQSKQTEFYYSVYGRSLAASVGNIQIEDLTFGHIRDWKNSLSKTRSNSTIRNYLAGVRMVLTYLRKQNVPVMDPELITLPKRDDKVPAFISAEEVQKLIDCCVRVRSKAIISLLYGSGIRLSELIGLDRSDIKGNTFAVIGKGDKQRPCFLDERTLGYLEAYLATRKDNHQALFISTQHNTGSEIPLRMTPTNIQLILKIARQKAGIAVKVTPHTLRHSFATNLLKNNCNIRHTQAMLGHADIRTTMRYTHVIDEDLHKVYSSFHTV